MIERRQRRSEQRQQAVSWYLAAAAARSGIHSAVLGTEEGLLVAGTGGGDHELLAAFGALHGMGRCADELPELTQGECLHSVPVVIRGEVLFLASLGNPFDPEEDVQRSLARILAH